MFYQMHVYHRQAFESDLALYQHCRSEHSISFVDARCCDAQLYTLAAFAAHAEAKHSEQHLCIRSVHKLIIILIFIEINNNDKFPLGCRCHEFFGSVEALEYHLEKHGAQTQACALFCILCGAYRRSENEISSHLSTIHNLDEECGLRFVCRVPMATEHVKSFEKKQLIEKDECDSKKMNSQSEYFSE